MTESMVWHKVSDGIPEDGAVVDVWETEIMGGRWTDVQYDGELMGFYVGEGEESIVLESVTHWMVVTAPEVELTACADCEAIDVTLIEHDQEWLCNECLQKDLKRQMDESEMPGSAEW